MSPKVSNSRRNAEMVAGYRNHCNTIAAGRVAIRAAVQLAITTPYGEMRTRPDIDVAPDKNSRR
jgi:hypothetical protein